jgi:hypothetical protein
MNSGPLVKKLKQRQRMNAMVFFLIRGLLRFAQDQTRLHRDAWTTTSQHYVSSPANSLLQWRQSYHDMFSQHCMVLANTVKFNGLYGSWTFESFCEMLCLEFGIDLDGIDDMIDTIDVDEPHAQDTRQLSIAHKLATLQVAKDNPRVLSKPVLHDKEREVKMMLVSFHDHERKKFKTFEDRFNGSRWGQLSQCIAANIPLPPPFTPFTRLFFSEVLLGQIVLCYLYSSFSIALNSTHTFINLWKSPQNRNCAHVQILFNTAVFDKPCTEPPILAHVFSCISKSFPPVETAKRYLREDKKTILTIFANCLFPPPRKGGKRDYTVANPAGRVSGAMAGPAVSGDMAGPAVSGAMAGPAVSGDMAGRAMAGDMADMAGAMAGDMAGDMAGPAVSGDMAGPAVSGDMADDDPELAHAVALSLSGIVEYDEGVVKDDSMQEGKEGGKKLIHKNKRSKSNKRSKTNKRYKFNKRSKSNKRSKLMKIQ